MAVFRVERTKGYTIMSNQNLKNKALSLKAIAIAERLRITATTLSGILTVKKQGREQRA